MIRNIVSKICIKDEQGILRNIFTVEGDISTSDWSIYIVKKNTVNLESQKTEEECREFELQRSLHARKDSDGKVRTHYKRGGKRFGKQQEYPLDHPNTSMTLYGPIGSKLSEYPSVVPNSTNVLLNKKSDYFEDYHYIFYTDKNKCRRALARHKLSMCGVYEIPTQYAPLFYISVAIKESRLEEIQKNRNRLE